MTVTSLIGASLLVVGFLALLRVFDLVPKAREVIGVSQRAWMDFANHALDDDAKERAMRGYAARLMRLFLALMLGAAAALTLPLLLIAALDLIGVMSFDEVMRASVTWPFLLGAAVATTAVMWAFAHKRQLQHEHGEAPALPGAGVGPGEGDVPGAGAGGFENRYSRTDRLLHRLAFTTTPAQIAIADMEDQLFRRRLEGVAVERPVFITALPRAGTTLLLELCAGLDEFVTHTYRHMPFIPLPLLWDRFSASFRARDELRERAHGDGMMVNADSPEAFEEVLWLAFWPKHYQPDRIRPWAAEEENAEFLAFFRQHIRKLASLRGPGPDAGAAPRRYISKNNLNIARIAWLVRVLPDARVVIPFRDPLQQAASLLRQHRNFLRIHEADTFAHRYMAAIGHFDFGANLRPVDFDGWIDRPPTTDAPRRTLHALAPTTLRFWLAYWVAGYRHLSGLHSDRVHLLDFDAFCAAPEAGLARLAHDLDLRDPEALRAQAHRIHSPPPHDVDRTGLDQSLLDEAVLLHARLRREA